MNLSLTDALSILNRLKGSSVFIHGRFAAANSSSLGELRVSTEATLEEIDEGYLRVVWPPNGHLYLSLERATFSFPDAHETALIGLQIELPEGIKCVIQPLKRKSPTLGSPASSFHAGLRLTNSAGA